MMESEAHAVRWAIRWMEKMKYVQWSKWHWTNDANFTICGYPIIIGQCDDCPLMPEHDERAEKVTCKKCIAALKTVGVDL